MLSEAAPMPGQALLLFADRATDIENVDQFFDEACECFEHGIAPWVGTGAGLRSARPPWYAAVYVG